MVAKGDRYKIWSRSRSLSRSRSRQKEASKKTPPKQVRNATATTISHVPTTTCSTQTHGRNNSAASSIGASTMSSVNNRFNPDEVSMADEESREDKYQYHPFGAGTAYDNKSVRSITSRSIDASQLAGIKDDRGKSKVKKLDPRPLNNNVRFISPGEEDIKTYSCEESRDSGHFHNEDNSSLDEDSIFSDHSSFSYGNFSKSYDSFWGDEGDFVADLQSGCYIINPALVPKCKMPSPQRVGTCMMGKTSLNSLMMAKDKASNVKEFFQITCTAEEVASNADGAADSEDIVVDIALSPVGTRDSIVDEFVHAAPDPDEEPRDGPPKEYMPAYDEGDSVTRPAGVAVPSVLSADGHVIVQYVVDVANMKDETPAQKWSRLSDHLQRHPKEAALQDEQCRTPLSYACQYGNDVPTVIMLDIIKSYPQAVSIPDKNGRCPLHYYVSHDEGGKKWQRNRDIVKLLVKGYPDITEMKDNVGNTPLHSAVENYAGLEDKAAADMRLPLINALIEENPHAATISNNHKSYPLHFAAKGYHAEVIESLLKHCPDAINASNTFGVTPLFLAVYWRAPFDALKVLLAANPQASMIRAESIGDDPITLIYHSLIYPSSEEEKEKERVARSRHCMNQAGSVKELPKDIRVEWLILELLAKAAYHERAFVNLPDTSWRPLHALCGLDVPPELVRFAIRFHRDDLYDRDEAGRLPLHIAALSPTYIKQPMKREAKHSLIRYILHEQDAVVARIPDFSGRLPIHYAAEARKSWAKGGMKHLVAADPTSLRKRDGKTGLYPFMLAAIKKPSDEIDSPHRRKQTERKAKSSVSGRSWDSLPQGNKDYMLQAIMADEERETLDTVYHMIRSAPELIAVDKYVSVVGITSSPARPKVSVTKMADEDIEVSHDAFVANQDLLSDDEGSIDENAGGPSYLGGDGGCHIEYSQYEDDSDEEASGDCDCDCDHDIEFEDCSAAFSSTRSASYDSASESIVQDSYSTDTSTIPTASEVTSTRKSYKAASEAYSMQSRSTRYTEGSSTQANSYPPTVKRICSRKSHVSFSTKGDDVISVDVYSSASTLTSCTRFRSDKYQTCEERRKAMAEQTIQSKQRAAVRRGLKNSNKPKKKEGQQSNTLRPMSPTKHRPKGTSEQHNGNVTEVTVVTGGIKNASRPNKKDSLQPINLPPLSPTAQKPRSTSRQRREVAEVSGGKMKKSGPKQKDIQPPTDLPPLSPTAQNPMSNSKSKSQQSSGDATRGHCRCRKDSGGTGSGLIKRSLHKTIKLTRQGSNMTV